VRKLHFKKKKLILSTAILTAFLTDGVMASEAKVATNEQPIAEVNKTENQKLAKKQALGKEATEVIEVTGLRGSLEHAQFIKRHANSVVDVISAEDIGQFSDASLTDALQRVPGVQIERDDAGTGGDRISIRGLGSQYVTTTINNRIMLSAGNQGIGNLRSANMNVLPPDVFNGVEVRKTATAVNPESGMAGQVDMQTLKPLDHRALKNTNTLARVGYVVTDNGLADDIGQVLKGVFAGKNEDETFGYFISAVKGKEYIGRDQVAAFLNNGKNYKIDDNGDGVYDEENDRFIEKVWTPVNIMMNPIRDIQERQALAAGFQYRPTDNFEVNVDVAHSLFENDSYRNRSVFVFGTPGVIPATAIDITEGENFNYLGSIDWTGVPTIANENHAPRLNTTGMRLKSETTTTVGGVNLIYYGDRLTTEFDIYYSGVDLDSSTRFSNAKTFLDQEKTSLNMNGKHPVWTGINDDILDPANYEHQDSVLSDTLLEGNHYGAALDFNYELGWGYIDSVDFGARYHTTDMDLIRTGDEFSGKALKIIPTDEEKLEMVAVQNTELTGQNFLDGDAGFTDWVGVDYEAGCAVISELCTLSGVEDLGLSKAGSFSMKEDVFALYVQANLDGELGDLPFSGNIGFRAVETTDTGNAYKIIETGFDLSAESIETKGSYWTYLPSLNLKFLPSDDTAVRFALNKTMSRGQLKEIAPVIKTSINENPSDPDYIPRATAGNPDLKPMMAISTDLTFEWYNSDKGAFIVSLFYKEVTDYIFSLITYDTVPGNGDQIFEVKKAVNYSDGKVKGFELGFYQPLTMLPGLWSGLGFSGSYTYVDSEIFASEIYEAPEGEDPTNAGFGFPGSSTNNVNLTAFYQKGGITTRLSYIYRDDYFKGIAGIGAASPTSRFTEGGYTLNFTANYSATKDLRFNFAVNNITENFRRDFLEEKYAFVDYIQRGRTIRLGASYTF